MTSNIGSRHLANAALDATSNEIKESTREAVHADLRTHFRPEFLNRIDDTILFHPLGLDQIHAIVNLMLAAINQRLADRRIHLTLAPPARDWIAERGYDPVYGARPLRRFLQRHLETPLAKTLIRGDTHDGQTLHITLRNGALTLTPAPFYDNTNV
jgi:ATP-dependent Clp protease ATP-binding subunit ClpB